METPLVAQVLDEVEAATREAQQELDAGQPLGEITYRVRRRVDAAVQTLVMADVEALQADLEEIAAMELAHVGESGVPVVADDAVQRMSARDWSPLGALESVQAVLDALSVERNDEAQPVMPLATISVTEDMATAMRMHAMGWESVYHHEVLAYGLAPEDLKTMLTQRLRWAQGTIQVLLRENPLLKKGMSLVQRLMYFATMWSYLSGFAAVVQALIQVGNSARLYCWPRQVLTPRPTTAKSNWLTIMNGRKRMKKSKLMLFTGRMPSVR